MKFKINEGAKKMRIKTKIEGEDLLNLVFGWGYWDIDFLLSLMNRFDINTDIIDVNTAKEYDMDVTDIDSYIYIAFTEIGRELKYTIDTILDNLTLNDEETLRRTKGVVIKNIFELKRAVYETDEDIFINYLDSCFNNSLYQWAMDEYEELVELFHQIQNYEIEDERFTKMDTLIELIEKIKEVAK